MLHRIFLVCLGLSVAGSALSCRWMDQKFKQLSENSLDLLEMMAHNSTNSTEDVEVSFPEDLYSQKSKASDEDKLALTVQVLEEVVLLFEEDHRAASWGERRLDDFLNVMSRQADGLRSCIVSHIHKKKNKKLRMYFKRLSRHLLHRLDYTAESWELIRKQIESHLMRSDLLLSSLLTRD
ncbi:interferon a3-like [Hippoglossus hippoglossus]|uniref:interferon a3-like n=1 Tax=Hippoglossus hippoglossus TaxID=8267 RepID=UPI00148BD4A6|nr:interferon a3-like [Hippoglossus hippoglossus]